MIIAGVAAGALLLIAAIGVAASSGGGDDKAKATTATTALATTTTVVRTTLPPTTTTTAAPAPVLTTADCTEMPPDGMLAKDGGAYKGQCLHFWAHVFQFDAATGPCSLMGNYDTSWHRYNFEYGNTIVMVSGGNGPGRVVQGTSGRVQLPTSSCVQLGPIAEDDNIEVWGIVEGVESYSTKAGGTNQYLKIGLVDAYKR